MNNEAIGSVVLKFDIGLLFESLAKITIIVVEGEVILV